MLVEALNKQRGEATAQKDKAIRTKSLRLLN
jgi:hypothetical protein